MMKDEGCVKQRGTLNADFPAYMPVIKNTRADCSYHSNAGNTRTKRRVMVGDSSQTSVATSSSGFFQS